MGGVGGGTDHLYPMLGGGGGLRPYLDLKISRNTRLNDQSHSNKIPSKDGTKNVF